MIADAAAIVAAMQFPVLLAKRIDDKIQEISEALNRRPIAIDDCVSLVNWICIIVNVLVVLVVW